MLEMLLRDSKDLVNQSLIALNILYKKSDLHNFFSCPLVSILLLKDTLISIAIIIEKTIGHCFFFFLSKYMCMMEPSHKEDR